MPPPYLVDIDGHPHPLKGQNGILELIRPPSKNPTYNKKKEEVDPLVDYDEFMKLRQVQLASDNKQLSKVAMNCLLNNHVRQNSRDTSYTDQPCCSSSASSQMFVQSQDSGVTMATEQTLPCNCKTDGATGSLSNGDVNAENGVTLDHSIANGYPTGQETTAVDHQSGKSFVDFNQKGQPTNQAVTDDQVPVNSGANCVGIQVNGQSTTCDQSTVNNKSAPRDQPVVNDQYANNDEINIIEFDNSDEPGDGNNNILTSIVWSCGLSDQEAKDAVSLWLSRTIIPYLDSEVYG